MTHAVLKPACLALAAALMLTACATKPAPAPIAATPPAPEPAPAEAESQDLPSLGNGAVAPGLQQQLADQAGDRVFFALDSHDLSAEARASLVAQARWLNGHPEVRVMVAGNCDERGTREYNLALGARRAAAARDLLVAQGVSGGRIATMSYGKERPLDAGTGEGAWSRNRNAATVVIDLAAR